MTRSSAYGVRSPDGDWMHCPITGARIVGSRARMRLYAKDMNLLGWHIRLKSSPAAGFVCRKLAGPEAPR